MASNPLLLIVVPVGGKKLNVTRDLVIFAILLVNANIVTSNSLSYLALIRESVALRENKNHSEHFPFHFILSFYFVLEAAIKQTGLKKKKKTIKEK